MVTHSKLILAAMTAALVVSGSASQAAGPTTTGPARLDLTASSSSHKVIFPDTDVAFRVDTEQGVATRADTTASTSATCDSCTGQSVSVHVLYLDQAPAVTLNNLAVAWGQSCDWCRTSAVSLQVAVLTDPGPLTANNRALSLNAACTMCASRSAAYQLVVPGNGQARLSDSTLAALETWATDRARLLLQPPAYAQLSTRTAKAQDLDDLADLLKADLNAAPMAAHARLSGR